MISKCRGWVRLRIWCGVCEIDLDFINELRLQKIHEERADDNATATMET